MMKNDKFCLWQVLLPFLPLLILLASCRKSAEETADNLRIEKLHQLDELLNAQSPQAKTEIEKGMKLAKDSLTFMSIMPGREDGSASRQRPILR